MSKKLKDITIDDIKIPPKKKKVIEQSRKNQISNISGKKLNGFHKKERFTYRTSSKMLKLLKTLSKRFGINQNEIIDSALIEFYTKTKKEKQ